MTAVAASSGMMLADIDRELRVWRQRWLNARTRLDIQAIVTCTGHLDRLLEQRHAYTNG